MDLILLLIFVSVSITFQEFSSGMKNGLFLRFFSLYIIFKVHRETSIALKVLMYWGFLCTDVVSLKLLPFRMLAISLFKSSRIACCHATISFPDFVLNHSQRFPEIPSF